MYLLLFNRVTEAIKALEYGDTRSARTMPIRAQQDAEELYMEGQDE